MERPYEKLELYGEKNLSNAELLAIIIKTGTKKQTSVEIAQEILKLNKNYDDGNLSFLNEISLEDLMKINGVGRVKAIQIKAVCELCIRMNKKCNYRKIKIKKPEDAVNLVMNDLRFEKKEIVKAIMIDNKNIVQKIIDVAVGGGNYSNIDIRYVLSETIKKNIPKIILAHNHPSGDPTPSLKDIEVTDRLRKAAKILNIELLDHIVIGNMNYVSIMEYQNRQNK